MTQQLPDTPVFATPTREQWLALVEKDLKGAPFEKKLVTQLIEGLTIQPLYTSADAPSQEALGLPGHAPFGRGSRQPAEVDRAWSVMPEHRNPLVEQANLAILTDLNNGAHGVVVRLSPRLLGDANPSNVCGCGGGVLIDSVDDLERLFAGVDLPNTEICIAGGPGFFAAAAQMAALYARRQVADTAVRCQFGADPLGTLAARGSLPRPAEAMLTELGALAKVVSSKYPNACSVTVSTAVYDNASATAVQELAAAVSTAVAYLRAMEDAGLSPTQASQQIRFSIAIGADQFLEMAKLRALRLLVNRVLELAGVPVADRKIRLHARTSRRILTQRDPWVNVLRTTVGCFAAALGGADQITVLPFDDVIGPSDAVAQRLARNTQIILQEEAHLGEVCDAAGGSYYVENLTLALAESAWKEFQGIESRGGMLAVLRDGSFAKALEGTWQKRSKDLARRKTPVTGVSEYPHLGEKAVERAKIELSQRESFLRERREQRAADDKASAALAAASRATASTQFAALVEAASVGATLFASHAAMGAGPGESIAALHLRRFAAAFERLRDQSDEYLRTHGKRPRIFAANMGPVAVHTARATFAQNFFEAGGFELVTNDGFADVASAVAAFTKSGEKTVIICSSDAWYDASACELGTALKQAGAGRVILAGNPSANETKYRDAGIDQFISIGCDVLGTLTELAQHEKVVS